MDKILISVIVPVYQIEKSLLKRCLSSLTNQSEKYAEFIIVDDGSPDNCGEIIDEYAALDNRFHAIHTRNLGVSNARNEGIQRARGEFIIFVDGDDFIEVDLCRKVVSVIEITKTDILFFMHQLTTENNVDFRNDESIELINPELLNRMKVGVISQENPIDGVWVGPPWGKVFRRSIIIENNLKYVIGLRKCQDRVFVLDYLLHTQTAALYRYIGYHYVINENSVCQRFNKDIISILEMAAYEFENRVKDIPNNIQYVKALDTMYMIFFCEIMLLDFFNRDNKASFLQEYKRLCSLLNDKEIFRNALRNGDLKMISRKRRLIVICERINFHLGAAMLAKILF